MNLVTLFNLLKQLMVAAFNNRNNKSHWEGWVDVRHTDIDSSSIHTSKIELAGKFEEVSVEPSGLRFKIKMESRSIVLEAKADITNPHKLAVFVDNMHQPDASVVVAPKNSMNHPIRVAVDFRPIVFDGDETRFNLRFNG